WQAADILGKIGKDAASALPNLAAALKDPDAHVRSVAARALGEIPSSSPSPGAIDGLREMLKSPDRLTAIRSLGKFTTAAAPAVTDLIHLLVDEEMAIRWNAAWALGKIGPQAKAAVPDLIRLLSDPESKVREHAAEALGDIGPDAAAAVPELIKA